MRVLDNRDLNVEDIYCIEILTALKWIETSGNEVSASTIYTCWMHCFNSGMQPIEELQVERNFIEKCFQRSGRIDIDDLLNPTGEVDVLEQVSNDCLTMNTVASNNHAAELGDIEPYIAPMPVECKLKALQKACKVQEGAELMSNHVEDISGSAQRL